jgi:Flp pilus assembly protein TadB
MNTNKKYDPMKADAAFAAIDDETQAEKEKREQRTLFKHIIWYLGALVCVVVVVLFLMLRLWYVLLALIGLVVIVGMFVYPQYVRRRYQGRK